MVGKKITELRKTIKSKSSTKIAFELKNLNKQKNHEFGISLKNINLKVNYGEITFSYSFCQTVACELCAFFLGQNNIH